MTSSGFVLEQPLNIHKSKRGGGGRGAFATHQAPALMYNSITKFSGSDLYPLIGVLMLEKACIYNFNANKCPYLAL